MGENRIERLDRSKVLTDPENTTSFLQTEYVPEGEMLFSAGDEGHEYFVTVRGQVEVLVQGADERGKAAGYQREERKKKSPRILRAENRGPKAIRRERPSFSPISMTPPRMPKGGTR